MTQDFNSLGLPAKLLQALARMQFTSPTPIQEQAIPAAIEGRDILGSAQTGTGKTGAFGIPMIAKLMENPSAIGVVLTPTRELATQVMKAMQQMIAVPDIKTALLIGGEPMGRQFKQLDRMPRLIVATPGRLNDHLKRKTLNLQDTAFLVLDETDRMLDMGFGIQIEAIRKFMPEKVQTLLFSATLPHNIVKLSSRYLTNPLRIAVGSTTQPIEKIKQEIIRVSEGDKHGVLMEQLEKRTGSIIIFVKTKYGTERLAKKLAAAGQNAEAIHGDLQQRKRERVIQSFRDKNYRILVATDVAARGLDIPHIEHVINYDLPQCPEDYIHRIGRTARNGEEGEAIALITPADQGKWRAIVALMPSKDQKDLSLPYEAGAPRKERDYSAKRKGGGQKWQDRKPGGPRKEWHAKGGQDRPFNQDRPSFNREERPFKQDRPFNKEGQNFERKPEDRKYEGKKPFGDRNFGEKKFADKKFADKKFDRPNGENRSFEKRDSAPGEAGQKKEFSKKEFRQKWNGEKRENEDRQPMTNENRDFSKREYRGGGEKRSFGEKRPFNRDGNRDGNREFNGERPNNGGFPPKPNGGPKKWQDRKPGGPKKEWQGKPNGDRNFGSKGGKGGPQGGPRGAGKPWQGKPRRPDIASAG